VDRDWLKVGIIWAALTALGEVAVVTWRMFPEGYTREYEVVDEAYVLLMIMAVPVFMFMVTMLTYSAIRFGSRERPTEDGPPMHGSSRVITAWLVITSALAVGILINPGFVGLSDIRGESSSDMVIEIEGQRWLWVVTYENGTVVRSDDDGVMVVPVDTRIRFDVTATDVLHSFWVPAFGTKIDAVPGRTTELYITTERTGTGEEDLNLRVQCAELCGLDHGRMAMPVNVVEEAEFEAWIEERLAVESAAAEEG